MKRSNVLMAVGTIGAVGAITLTGTSVALADSNKSNDNLAQKIAQKFNLNQNEVQAVINENRQARHEDRLDNLVKDGKITEAQKELIINKMQEWDDIKPDFTSMNTTERLEAMQKHRDEMIAWAKDNGIDPNFVDVPKGKHGGRHMGLRHGPPQTE